MSDSTDPEVLNGPLFGLRSDFQGFGIVFDVYDNDNRRDNPSIFVLRNDEGVPTKFNHDNDFAVKYRLVPFPAYFVFALMVSSVLCPNSERHVSKSFNRHRQRGVAEQTLHGVQVPG